MRLTNTLTGCKDEFVPSDPQYIKMYACGVTVYDKCHLGHAMQAILYDIFARYLRFKGYKVTYVRNFTDVDDKIIARASQLGVSPLELSDQMIEISRRDMLSLKVKPADFEPRVSEYIPQIIAYIQDLMTKGFAYVGQDGSVYFRVRLKEDYGKLSRQNISELRCGVRKDVETGKEDPVDFALWKVEETPGATWDSPWGRGRPGWHIECSVMASEILGDSFDIHGGGRDLVFPHHENEIAQSEAKSGGTYARYWVHNGLLTVNRQKMSKSLNNFISIEDAVRDYGYELIRFNIYQYHYQSNIDFSAQGFFLGLSRLYSMYRTRQRVIDYMARHDLTPQSANSHPGFHQAFCEAMDDDFNLPRVMVVIQSVLQSQNEIMDKKFSAQNAMELLSLESLLHNILPILEIGLREPQEFFHEIHSRYLALKSLTFAWVTEKIELRMKHRTDKNFAMADQIRDELLALGVSLLDSRDKTSWELSEKALEELILLK
ncbi:MAG: cysteine--tRNA ligase [Candidatus Cloacimonetes bacterium]|nr:cysteine--tRNA ligase [Candidatus Cloacimonadota bacterium]